MSIGHGGAPSKCWKVFFLIDMALKSSMPEDVYWSLKS